jgi:hypothetical protein
MEEIDDMPEYLDCNSVLLTGDINTEKLTKIFQDNLEIVAFSAKKKLDAVNKVQPSKENMLENASWVEKLAATRKAKHVTFGSNSTRIEKK